ncbi:MAG: DUF4271 domain-containing protein [Winogradskyella sp.]|nr:DUF4271 domain-containing protein [Winogradskyella sp.]
MLREVASYDWFTILSVICLISIAFAKALHSLRFNDFLMVITNSKYLKIYSRDPKFIDSFDSFLFVNFAISLSIFCYLAFSNIVTQLQFELISFFKLLLLISIILVVKVLLERLIGSLFEIDALMDAYLFQKTTFKNYCGLLLFGFNLILIYGDSSSKFVIFLMLFMIIGIILIGFFTSYKNHQKLLNFNFFYFLLYLCALEIGPYIIVYKVIRDYNP